MRTTQIFGLTEEALKLLNDYESIKINERGVRTYPDGRTEHFEREVTKDPRKIEKCGSFCGMFDEECPLHRYTMPNGKVYEEYVQADPWSSGPCFFLALRDENGPIEETLWSDEDIDNA